MAAGKAKLTEKTPAERAQEQWADYVKSHLAPWQDLGLAFLAWLGIAVLAVRFAPRFTRNKDLEWVVGNGIGRPLGALGLMLIGVGAAAGTFAIGGVDPFGRPVLLILAGVLAVLAAYLFIACADFIPRVLIIATAVLLAAAGTMALGVQFELPRSAFFLPGVVVTILGVLAVDAKRRSQCRLLVTVEGEKNEQAVANLRGIIADMGATRPRGIEMPRGPDSDFLSDVKLEELAPGAWSKAVQLILTSLRPYAPWELSVDVVSSDRLSATLSRNYEVVAAEIIDRKWLDLEPTGIGSATEKAAEKPDSDVRAEGKGDQPLELLALPAALALVTIAHAHGELTGLGGANDWRSVALQYLASAPSEPEHSVVQRLLGRAIDLDPSNRYAVLSGLIATYRRSDEAADLHHLAKALTRLIHSLTGPDNKVSEPALVLRARYSLTATKINLVYADKSDGNRQQSVEVWEEFYLLLEALKKLDVDGKQGQQLARSMQPVLHRMRRSVEVVGRQNPDQPIQTTANEWDGPRAHYSRACGLMPLNGAPSAADAESAVRFLSLADMDPDLAAARTKDPQLEILRDQPAYRKRYGQDIGTDLLRIKPFSDYAETLRALQLTNAAAISTADPAVLRRNLIPDAVVQRMTAAASLAVSIPRDLTEWRVPIISFLIERNVLTQRDLHPGLTVPLVEALADLKKTPGETRLAAWLDPPQGWPPTYRGWGR